MSNNMRDMTLNLIVNSQVNRIKEFNKELKNTDNNINNTTKKVGWLGRTLRNVFGAYIGIQTVKSFVKTYRSLDLMRRSIEGLTQSTQDWNYIQKEAFRTATDIEVVARGYRNFYAAATMAGVDKTGVQTMYSNILEAGRAVGATQRQVEGALLALEQMFSKGKVSMEELRRQLGNALPGAFEIAAKSMGVTTQQFNEMIKKGVQATDLVPKFTAEYRKTFAKSFPEAMKSLDAAIVNLHNSWKLFQYDFGRSGVGRDFAKVIVSVSQFLQSNKLKSALASLGYIIGKLLVVVKFLVDNLGTILWLLAPIALGGAITKIIALLKDVIKWIYVGNLALNSTQLALFRIYLLIGWLEEILAFFTDKEGLLETALVGKNHSWIDRLGRLIALLIFAFGTIEAMSGGKITRGLIKKFGGDKLKEWAGVEEKKLPPESKSPKEPKSRIINPKTGEPFTQQELDNSKTRQALNKKAIETIQGRTVTSMLSTAGAIAMGLMALFPQRTSKDFNEILYPTKNLSGTNLPRQFGLLPSQLSKTETYAPNITYNPQYKIDATGMTPDELMKILEYKDQLFFKALMNGKPSMNYNSLFPVSGGGK